MAEKIPIIPIALEYQKPTEIQDCFVEFHEKYLYYRMRFFADEPVIDEDKDSGWSNRFNSFDTYVDKEKISGIERCFTTNKKWGVYIIISGFATDLKIFFKKENEAVEFADKIVKWLFSL